MLRQNFRTMKIAIFMVPPGRASLGDGLSQKPQHAASTNSR